MNLSTKLRSRCLRWQTFVFWIVLSVAAWAAPEKDFTVVALPDTQHYSEKYPQIWTAQLDWIVANRKDLNIVYVVHLGDITQNGDGMPEEWAIASNALSRLENPTTTGLPEGIPYGVVPGNHDHRGGTVEFNKGISVPTTTATLTSSAQAASNLSWCISILTTRSLATLPLTHGPMTSSNQTPGGEQSLSATP